MFDVVVIVGALSVAQVPVGVVRELCQSTKPGKHINFFFNISTAAFTLSVCFKHSFSYFIFSQTPGGYVCMTTRGNCNNIEYKVSLELELEQMEQEGLWTRVEVTEVEDWERAVSEEEHGYIPGAVYLYKKQLHSAAKV